MNFFDPIVLELIPHRLLLKREGERRAYRGKIPFFVREGFRSKTRFGEVSSLNILFIFIRGAISSVERNLLRHPIFVVRYSFSSTFSFTSSGS